VVVDADKKKLRSRNAIFMEGNRNQSNRNEPSLPGLQDGETAHIEEMTDASKSEADDKDTINPDTSNAGKRRTQSEVWGTDPTRHSGCLSTRDMSDKVLIAKSTKPSDSTDIITPRAYADAISLPE